MKLIQRINAWLESYGEGVYLHAIDDAKQDRKQGIHRRLWAHVHRWTFRTELSVPSTTFALGVSLDEGENGLLLRLAVPPVGLFIGLEGPGVNALQARLVPDEERWHGPRAIEVRIFDSAIWWKLWHTVNRWESGTPRWRDGNFRPLDALFGKHDYKNEVVSECAVKVPMPEGWYEGTCKMERASWIRPRWPWFPLSKTIMRAHVDIPDGVPFPGKGENSYDCGQDACYGMTTHARNAEDAVGQIVGSVLHDRQRYGGDAFGWRPELKAPSPPSPEPDACTNGEP